MTGVWLIAGVGVIQSAAIAHKTTVIAFDLIAIWRLSFDRPDNRLPGWRIVAKARGGPARPGKE